MSLQGSPSWTTRDTNGHLDYADRRSSQLFDPHPSGSSGVPSIHVNGAKPNRRSESPDFPAAETNEASHFIRNGAIGVNDDPDFGVAPDDFSEGGTAVSRRNLDVADVFALVFNKMVGTGIFTTSGLVLKFLHSKDIAVGLWAVGGVYTSLCLLIYIQYGTWFPYNGGELIYLGRIFPFGFLCTIFFSFYQLCFGFTAGNTIAFARYIQLAANPELQGDADLDKRLTRFIAIVALTVVCLILSVSQKFGMFLNKMLALFKIFLLIIVFARGVAISHGDNAGRDDWHRTEGHNFREAMSALIPIIYSYAGWENANYVAGEIREMSEGKSAQKLLIGAMSAVFAVTILYLLVVIAYFLSTSHEDIISAVSDLGMGTGFAPKAFGGSGRSLKVLIAISALGNLVSVVFTSAKIKQAIARQRFIPFWRFLEKDQATPKGGLFLHWLVTTMWVLALPNDTDGYLFVIGISTWGRILIEIAVIGGVLCMLYRGRNALLLPTWPLGWALPALLAAFNALVIVVAAMETGPDKIPRWLWPVIMGGVLGLSLLYWVAIKLLAKPLRTPEIAGSTDDRQGSHVTSDEGSNLVRRQNRTIGSRLGLDVHVYEVRQQTTDDGQRAVPVRSWPERLNHAMGEARIDGTERRVDTQFTHHLPPKVDEGLKRAWEWFVRYLC